MTAAAPNAEGRLVIDLQNFPAEGRDLEGSIEQDIFQLESNGPRPVSPLIYSLHVERRGGWLVVEGDITTVFELECVRCLEPFREQVSLLDYRIDEELTDKSLSVDLTDRIREDILLALPGYPHCDESTLAPRTCPAAGRFQPASSYSPDQTDQVEADARPEVWNALDQLKIEPSAPPKKPGKS